jgi:hypothetical protein
VDRLPKCGPDSGLNTAAAPRHISPAAPPGHKSRNFLQFPETFANLCRDRGTGAKFPDMVSRTFCLFGRGRAADRGSVDDGMSPRLATGHRRRAGLWPSDEILRIAPPASRGVSGKSWLHTGYSTGIHQTLHRDTFGYIQRYSRSQTGHTGTLLTTYKLVSDLTQSSLV